MQIIPVSAFKDNYIWVMIDPSNAYAAIVDPGDAEPVITFLKQQQLQLTAILITHHHWDHTGGVEEILKHYEVPVYGPAHDGVKQLDYALQENDQITLEQFDRSFSIIDIPGHTLGHIAYYSDGILFSGDTLFAAGCGKLFEGSAEQMYHSLSKLLQLPEDTMIYCGHEYTEANLRFAQAVEPNNKQITERLEQIKKIRAQGKASLPCSLAVEKQTNPFLRCDIVSVQKAAAQYNKKKMQQSHEIFATLRAWKNCFTG